MIIMVYADKTKSARRYGQKLRRFDDKKPSGYSLRRHSSTGILTKRKKIVVNWLNTFKINTVLP
jgi:hypothetical protein